VEPQTLDVEIRQPAKLTAKASGVGIEEFRYKWKRNGSDISGETGLTLEFACTDISNSGRYECIIENEYGDRNKSSAQVNVTSKYCIHFICSTKLTINQSGIKN